LKASGQLVEQAGHVARSVQAVGQVAPAAEFLFDVVDKKYDLDLIWK
jgi:hypothetical protein